MAISSEGFAELVRAAVDHLAMMNPNHARYDMLRSVLEAVGRLRTGDGVVILTRAASLESHPNNAAQQIVQPDPVSPSIRALLRQPEQTRTLQSLDSQYFLENTSSNLYVPQNNGDTYNSLVNTVAAQQDQYIAAARQQIAVAARQQIAAQQQARRAAIANSFQEGHLGPRRSSWRIGDPGIDPVRARFPDLQDEEPEDL
jgi:hypothetical protein